MAECKMEFGSVDSEESDVPATVVEGQRRRMSDKFEHTDVIVMLRRCLLERLLNGNDSDIIVNAWESGVIEWQETESVLY